jgi:hypothetical protein
MRIRLAALVVLLVVATPARGADTGTIVVRLLTDPSPAGVAWSYAGLDTPFSLGLAGTSHTASALAPGTYRIVETSPDPNRPPTLTGIVCGASKGDLASATATVTLAAGETVTCTFTHRALGPTPSASAAALAAQYAPTLRLSSAEHYKPISMEQYLAHATLKTGTPPRGTTAQTKPTLFTLSATAGATYLDVRTAEPYLHATRYRSIEQQLEAGARPTVYWRSIRQASTGTTAIEYWFLYLYNDFTDRHEADWEGVTVFLRDGAPIGVTDSRHQGRSWTPWPATAVSSHPVVYVAAGSHANYSSAGRYSVKVCFTIRIRRCTSTTRRDDARGDGAKLTPPDYDLHTLGGTGYTGSWGSGNYVLGFGLTKDRVVDPRRRSEYSNPFASLPPGA